MTIRRRTVRRRHGIEIARRVVRSQVRPAHHLPQGWTTVDVQLCGLIHSQSVDLDDSRQQEHLLDRRSDDDLIEGYKP